MIKAPPEPGAMPDINPEKVYFIVEKAREWLDAEEGASTEGSDPDSDLDRLTHDPGKAFRDELVAFITDLDVDEQDALVAMMWIGRGDFEPEHWLAAVKLAGERQEVSVADYLLGSPQLPDYLEEALADFGFSNGDLGDEEA